MDCSMPGFPVLHHLLELAQTHVHWVSDAILSSSVAPFSFCLQSFPELGFFFNELALHNRWPNYWSFSFSISPSNEYSGLISFRIDRFDLLAVQGTLKTLLQHYSSKASIIWHSVFFMVQLLHPYMTTGKTIALTTDFCGKVMLLLLLLLLSCFSHLWFCATPETAAHQAPPSLGFSRQEHWSGLPFPSLMHASEKWKWSRSVVSNS